MKLISTIRLLLTFYRSFFLFSILITLLCTALAWEYGTALIGMLIGIKFASTLLIFFFIRSYKRKEFYYYLNRGLSGPVLWTATLLFDTLLFVILLWQAANSSPMHQLHADNIRLTFGSRTILQQAGIHCSTGAITGLLGRNGSGKSCLFRILYGDLPADSRDVRFDGGTVLHPFRQPDLIRYLPQFHFIPGNLTPHRVLEDFGLDFTGLQRHFPELAGSYRTPVRDLSGGQQRLIELYIILRSASRFALLDEPFTHLMPLQIEKVKELLREARSAKGLLITDHLYRDVMAISDQVYVLANGQTHAVTTDHDIERLGYLPARRN